MDIRKNGSVAIIRLLYGLLSFAGIFLIISVPIIPLILVTVSFLSSFFAFLIYTKRSLFLGVVLSYGTLLLGTLVGYLELSSLRGSGFGGLGIAVAIFFGLGIAWFIDILSIPIWLIHIDKARGIIRSARWYRGLILILYTLGFGFLSLTIIQNLLIDRVTSLGYEINEVFLTTTFPAVFGWIAWLISGIIGFYIARLLGHLIHDSVSKVSLKLTIGIFVLIAITIGMPLILEESFRKKETQEIETLTQELTLTDFEEQVISRANSEDLKLEVSAVLFTPREKSYWIEAALVDLSKERNRDDAVLGFGYEPLLPSHEISIVTSEQTIGKYGSSTLTFQKGDQSMVFVIGFDEFFEERVNKHWINLLREASENNSLGIEIFVSTSSYGRNRGEPILHTTHRISRQSLQELGVLELLNVR